MIDSDEDALAESELLIVEPDVDAETLVEPEAADSLPDSDGVVELLVDSDAADSLVVVDVEVDPEAADSLPDSDGVVELLVDSDAADSLVLCDVDSVVDSVAESLVAPLPGVSAVLPSVASVCRSAAVTSYETGV